MLLCFKTCVGNTNTPPPSPHIPSDTDSTPHPSSHSGTTEPIHKQSFQLPNWIYNPPPIDWGYDEDSVQNELQHNGYQIPLPDHSQTGTSPYSDQGMPNSPDPQATVPYEDYDMRTCIPAQEWSPMGDGRASGSGLQRPPPSERFDLSSALGDLIDEDIHTDEPTDEEDVLMDESATG